MKIKKIEFKNINSYGNNIQYIDCFNENGSLILLHGDNGAGKSTIKQVIDITIFSKTTGKNGKRLAIKELANRRNGSMYTSIIFENHKNQNIQMKRWVKPNKFEIIINDNISTEQFKNMNNKEREQIIGYSYDIFKSFISINMNDFKNFISLNKDDKETLLNKLFNLNELDDLYSIAKELDKTNQTKIYEYENLINENELLIIEYISTLTKIKETQQISKKEKLLELKQQIFNLKPEYDNLIEKIKINQEKKEKLNKKNINLKNIKLNKEREKTKIEIIIENLNEKIKTYKSGICPICNTILTDNSHLNTLKKYQNEIKIKENMLKDINIFLNKCILEDTKIRNNNDTLYKEKINLNQRLTEIKILLKSLNKEYKELKNSLNDINVNTGDLEEKIKLLKEKNKKYQEIIDNLEIKSITYDKLLKILSFDGIRKTLIKNAITPINIYLSNYLKRLESIYTAKLSDSFDATIYELETLEINSETLSKGEDRKINISIALSYLKIIMDMKHSNVIFLDEIFDGLSMTNIVLILDILKEMSKIYKTNIIVVAHGISEMKDFNKIVNNFDYIIEAKKDIFSNLNIKKIN